MPLNKYHCDVCALDISRITHIRCAKCNDFDLCIPCFASGSEIGTHKSDHSYRVIEQPSFPIFDKDWGADEELMLIEGLDSYGLGNWQDVADYLGNGRSKEECEKHYHDIYISSPSFPYAKRLPFDVDREEFQKRRKERVRKFSTTDRLVPPQKQKPVVSTPSCHEIQGYMPGRLEFETEYENDAELTIKDINFDEDISENAEDVIELKLTILDIYNSKLDKRAERKKVIFEHGLLDYRKNLANEKKRTKDERELINKTKAFARLQNSKDYDAFVEGLLNELKIRRKIAELQKWRQNGFTTLEQGQKYERDRSQKVTKSTILILKFNLNQQLAMKNPLSLIVSDRYISRHTKNLTGKLPQSASQEEFISFNQTKDSISKPLKKPAISNISTASGLHLLTLAEQTLCNQLHILPKPYLVIKDIIFRKLIKTGGQLKKRQARELIKIDISKTSRIVDFMISQGWIKNKDST
ncbi:hypothetical protein T552_03091 [Pneumocystis carinii B80]|uniref:Transcriptional adapter 2 n=1 Tax=Pneumocystis carinii (strain B80) TaxID=1408658 RepID=A0A0W4ZD16_PNEC8|nr:hypothetical protein T552_03091 [Pneumocystis carinii B80]KTW26199.1 hypothetical protein T552_03091 [Pneumocystis carinii B80]